MDIDYLLFLQNIRNAGNGSQAEFAAFFSDTTANICFGLLFFLYWSFKKEHGLYGLMGLTMARYINAFVKLCACVYRPWIRDPRVVPPASAMLHATGYSFPSGHTTTVAGGLGMLGWLCRKNKLVLAFCTGMLLLTMFSRNFLGVHTPQDVIVGCATGFLAVFAVCRMTKWESAGGNRDLLLLGILLLLDIAVLIFISCKNYPLDYHAAGKLLVDPAKMQKDGWKDIGSLTGVIIGWIIEKRYVNFTIPSSWGVRIARFIPGFVLFLIADGAFRGVSIQNVFALFLGKNCGALAGNVVLCVFFLAVYPMIFMKIEKFFCRQTRTALR